MEKLYDSFISCFLSYGNQRKILLYWYCEIRDPAVLKEGLKNDDFFICKKWRRRLEIERLKNGKIILQLRISQLLRQ